MYGKKRNEVKVENNNGRSDNKRNHPTLGSSNILSRLSRGEHNTKAVNNKSLDPRISNNNNNNNILHYKQ